MRWLQALAAVCLWSAASAAWPQQSTAPAVPPAPAAPSAEIVEQRTQRGPVEAVVRIEPATVRIGDPVNLTIEVRAAAGVELLMPVFGAALERFTILEFVPREMVDPAGRTVSTQTYRLQAPASGTHSIPPVMVEFVDRRPGQRATPEDEDAFELLTERLGFTVTSVVPEGAGNDLKPRQGPLEPLTTQSARPWPWVTAGLAALAAIGVALWCLYRWRTRARQQSAYDVALSRLDSLVALTRPADRAAMDGFFVELSDIVRRYLEAQFALHAPEFTTEEFLDVAASSPDLTRNHRSFLQAFLRSADQVKFARHVPDSADVETALTAVRGFLQQTGSGSTEGNSIPPAAAGGQEPAHV